MKKSKPAQNPGPGEDVPALLVGRGNPAGFSLAGRKAGERTTLPSSYRLELCQELIEEAMKCLGNSDKERTMKLSAIFTRFTKPPRAAPREFRRA